MSTTPTPTGSTALVCIPSSHRALVARPRAHVAPLDPVRMVWCRMAGLIDRIALRGPARSPDQLLSAVWSRLLAWRMRRVTRTILVALDDRTLADIGVHRGEIDHVLRHPEWRTRNRLARRRGT